MLAAVGAVAAVVGLVAVVRGDLPINQRMATWTATDLPATWQDERRRWERWFAVRTVAAAVAAVSLPRRAGHPGRSGLTV